jgi:ubiquinone/menaquinone biosynthesis C-methylase UbiE
VEATLGGVAGERGAKPGPVEDPNAIYALGSSGRESARLERQADELAPDSSALLDRVGPRPGDSVIDVGCGPRGVLELLHERVMPGGRVVGLDGDPAHVAMATELVAKRRLSGVEVVCADARHTGLESNSFDLVHHRTLLVTVPDPGEVLAEMVRLARPSGWVAGLEADTEHAICYPPDPAFDRLNEIFTAVFSRNGADPHLGRRLHAIYRHAGLEDVAVDARAGVYPPGHSRRTIRADLVRAMRPQVLEMGLADEQQLDQLDRQARAHLADPDTVVMPSLMFLAWGRKPTTA